MSVRRSGVPFDPYHFEKLERQGQTFSIEETFRHIHQTNHWGAASTSGAGAAEAQTRHLAAVLPPLLRELNVQTLLDAPCGDFGWMRQVNLPGVHYVGADILPELAAENQHRYGDERHRFVPLDLTRDPLPDADLLLCRDALVHLSFADIFRVLDNVRRSRIPYLLTTTFPDSDANEDITTGDWRLLTLVKPPFNLPPPVQLLVEHCTEGGGRFRDKSLGLWRVANLTELSFPPA